MPRVSEATKREHRQRLLDAAIVSFAAQGLANSRVDDISVAAGLAKGTIYNYFESKEELFRQVLVEWARRLQPARLAVDDQATARETVLALVRADLDVITHNEDLARIAFRELPNQPDAIDEELEGGWAAVDQPLVDAILRGQQTGEIRSDRSADELTRLLLALVNGLLLEHWLDPHAVPLEALPDLAVDIYFDGAASR